MDNIRKAHNLVKRNLIQKVVPTGAHVLDVGCGRGGDLQKWAHCAVKLDACDPDKGALEEAIFAFEKAARDEAPELRATALNNLAIAQARSGDYSSARASWLEAKKLRPRDPSIQRNLDLLEARTSFVVAHRLSTLRNADRLLVLERGKLVGFGTHDALLGDCPVYRRMWQAQQLRTQDERLQIEQS